MKTSTPTDNFTKRGRVSFRQRDQELIAIDGNDEAIENEIQNRRLEAINKSKEIRKSVAPPLLDIQHFKDCLKLSTENKINSKNAFSLLLIDFMAAMAKKKDSEISQNFQVASCTLDASVKIYGYRVDAVHSDVLKMAVAFAAQNSKKVNNVDEENEDNIDGEEVKLKTKKRKKKSMISKPDSLNAKNEMDALLDVTPTPNLYNLKKDGNDLLIRIPKHNDSALFMIDPEFQLWPYDGSGTTIKKIDKEEGETFEISELFKRIDCTANDSDVGLCSAYNYFEFGKDYVDESRLSDTEMDISHGEGDFEFDINVSVEDVQIDESNDIFPVTTAKVSVPLGGYESGEEINVPERYAQVKGKPAHIFDMTKRISKLSLEYSLFDENIFKSWAGPTFWKTRPTLSKRLSGENQENEENVKQQIATKRTRKGKTITTLGLFDIDEKSLAKHLASGDKSILTKPTMLNWNPKYTTIPKDCKYKSKTLFSTFHIPPLVVEPRFDDVEDTSHADDIAVENSDQEEQDYCSSMVVRDEFGEDHEQEHTQTEKGENEVLPDVGEWGEENMVAVPTKVEKVAVTSVIRTKHIDIKHLKKCMWNFLLDPDHEQKPKVEEKMPRKITFSELIKSYPSRFPNTLVAVLTPALVFNALLHLTNEKCLELTQNDPEKFDFDIFQL